MTTLVEFMIIADANNRPPTLEKSMYDSWKSRMELYIENRENGRMILNSVQDGHLVFHEMCMPLSNIIDLPNRYGIELSFLCKAQNCHDKKRNVNYMMSLISLFVPVFTPGDDPIACINKVMAFMSVVAASRVIVQQVQGRQRQSYVGTGNKGNATSYRGNNAGGQARVVKCYNFQGQAVQTTIPNNEAFQTEDLDAYHSECHDVFTAYTVLMTNISNYGSDVLLEVPHSEPYHNDMDNQGVHAMQAFEQTPVIDFVEYEITSDSNIISYSQYLQETQYAAVQDTNLYAQQDSMILYVVEQMAEQMINHVNN
ncbi:hypothetical protein Tco_0933900 [Tanacetum coccineum]